MAIDYNDQRFQDINEEKQQAIDNNSQTYDSMINQSDVYYQNQIDAAKQWSDAQIKNQQEQTDFAIEQVNQQKNQAKKDYIKEQSGAYTDWQKQSNKYGVNAEQMAANGMVNTGYSESSQVSMYNTYQGRVVAARESFNKAVLNYDNAIKEARLQNSSAKAQIAYEALKSQLELSLQGFQYKNQLLLDKASSQREIDNTYHSRYLDVLNQINTENALAEEKRQYDESMAENRRQFDANLAEEQRQFSAEYGLKQQQLAEEKRQIDEKNTTVVIDDDTTELVDTKTDASVYGTFKNGYQPKGISGHGVLSKTGNTVDRINKDGKMQEQNIWEAEDGTIWVWNGQKNVYEMFTLDDSNAFSVFTAPVRDTR